MSVCCLIHILPHSDPSRSTTRPVPTTTVSPSHRFPPHVRLYLHPSGSAYHGDRRETAVLLPPTLKLCQRAAAAAVSLGGMVSGWNGSDSGVWSAIHRPSDNQRQSLSPDGRHAATRDGVGLVPPWQGPSRPSRPLDTGSHRLATLPPAQHEGGTVVSARALVALSSSWAPVPR